jgi:hypothetical protein
MRFRSTRRIFQIALAFVGITAALPRAHAQSQSVSAGALGTQVLKGFQGLSPTTTGHVASASAVWSTYTAPKSGLLQLDTSGSTSDTTLAVYTGANLFKLQEVAYNDDAAAGTKTSLVKIKVEPGITYRVALDQKPASSKHVVALNRAFLESETSPAIYYGVVTIPASTLVKAELDAPKPAKVDCEFVTWQKIKALRDGTFTADTVGSAINTVLAVYSGTEGAAVKDLKLLASNDDHGGKTASKVSCPVKSGTWLFIQIGGKGKARGNVVVNYSLGD